jgi:hypothetical protein
MHQVLASNVENIISFVLFPLSTETCLKIPKGQPQSVYRRTDNTMTKGKRTKGKTTKLIVIEKYCSRLNSNKITSIKSDTFSNLTNFREL